MRLVPGGPWLVALATTLACAPSASTPMPSAIPPDLNGTSWVLASLPGRAALAGRPVTAQFADGKVAGSDGCNRYTAPYTLQNGGLTIGPNAAGTMMACPPEVMDQGKAVLAALTGARAHRIANDRLELLDADGKVLATFDRQATGLAGTAWTVTGYSNGKQAVVSVASGSELTLEFAPDGKVSGSAGCNRFTGSYTLEGSAVQFGPAATTRKLCATPEGVMEQEAQFLAALASAATLRQEGDAMELRRADGALAVSARKR
ncbi:MAG: META domain-containing protein [Gemmatimonadales bacterium]|nr:META domain-containing protein [Gemmatimonadales bacterium]